MGAIELRSDIKRGIIALCPILPVQNKNKIKSGSFIFKHKFPCLVYVPKKPPSQVRCRTMWSAGEMRTRSSSALDVGAHRHYRRPPPPASPPSRNVRRTRALHHPRTRAFFRVEPCPPMRPTRSLLQEREMQVSTSPIASASPCLHGFQTAWLATVW